MKKTITRAKDELDWALLRFESGGAGYSVHFTLSARVTKIYDRKGEQYRIDLLFRDPAAMTAVDVGMDVRMFLGDSSANFTLIKLNRNDGSFQLAEVLA